MKINIRKDRMTKYERLLAILNRQPTDRIPVWGFAMGFTTLHCGLSIADAYNNPKKMFDAINSTTAEFGWQDMPAIAYASMGAWEFGGDIKWPSGEWAQAPSVTRRPVEKEEDVKKLQVPADVTKAGIVPLMMEINQMQAAAGFPIVNVMVNGGWGLACNIAGPDTVCKWALKRPEVVKELTQKANDFAVKLMRYWVDTFGADRLLAWVSGGSATATTDLISPQIFEKFVLPTWEPLLAEARAMGIKYFFAHICGEQNLNMPYWAKLRFSDNPAILTFGHEVDLDTASKYFPRDIIMGNVEPAYIQVGTPEQVYELTRKCIEKGRKHPGGFILAPGCELPPRSPADNVWAMMQAVSDHGWY